MLDDLVKSLIWYEFVQNSYLHATGPFRVVPTQQECANWLSCQKLHQYNPTPRTSEQELMSARNTGFCSGYEREILLRLLYDGRILFCGYTEPRGWDVRSPEAHRALLIAHGLLEWHCRARVTWDRFQPASSA